MNAKTPRHKMPEQKPEERIKNFNEVPLGYTAEMAIAEAERCLQCKKPACVEGCPVNVRIPEFIKEVAEGNFLNAIEVIKGTNSLPAVCGRVCPQESQCEAKCVLGKKFEPVAIGKLEGFVADYEREKEHLPAPVLKPKNGKKVAIIGSGPAGLTVAGELAKLGYAITVYEALHTAGGVLVYGIPEFRLPKKIVSYEIEALAKMGVEFVTNRVVGLSETLADVMQRFDAAFVATGAGLPSFLNIPGEDFQGVYSANEYLTRVNLMKAYKFPEYDTPVIKGRSVGVFGAGNVAMDSARTAIRLGSEEVHLVYRRSRDEMPARAEEIHHAEEEGLIFDLLCNPVKFIGDENGRLSGVECVRMELGEPDDSGRRRPVEIKGSEFTIDIDVAIIAIGNGSNPILQKTAPDLKCNKWGNIIADPETMRTSVKGVFAGGDIVTGAATVIQAMGAGRKAAKGIDDYLTSGEWQD
ncbi:MAG TPA: NADPH-dependent glutamate synthase [Spirochaetota bacterium]|nr:NADPH-dependent glutamate synthase [Spirochaetota bacterium]HPF04496.1 NADPH-dependent glutamate synthase [Spirochaetota bacterium]HPJ42171.1 NADPH-dependent glutamate synthase [Spirochaetota bacterium]HPR38116.1 NADPH-dependent glutamate synthase [Spirochaetota bacterium]HRX46021.1 NADPH-dependent glutamate synthase [Spirochaetota bacterium]